MLDWIAALLDRHGYVGVALLMLAENVFPPIPSELIMPLAGFAAAQGRLDPLGVVLAGAAGSIGGGVLWYLLGQRLGLERIRRLVERHGRWAAVDEADVDRAQGWFDRHGGKAVLYGRLVPAVRTLVSLPAGIAGLAWRRFLLLSAIGTTAWTGLLAVAGYLLAERWMRVQSIAEPIGNAAIAALVAGYAWRVLHRRRRGRAGADPPD